MPDYSFKDVKVSFYDNSRLTGEPTLEINGTARLYNPNLSIDEQLDLFEGYDAEDLRPIFIDLGHTSPITPYWYNASRYLANYLVHTSYQPYPTAPFESMELIVTSFFFQSGNYNAINVYIPDRMRCSTYADSMSSIGDNVYRLSINGQGIYDLGWLESSPLYLRILYNEDEFGVKTIKTWSFSLYACTGVEYDPITGEQIPKFNYINIHTSQPSLMPRVYDITDREEPSEDDMKIKKPYVGQFFNRQYCMTIRQCEDFSSNLASLTGSVSDFDDVIKRLKGFYNGFTDWLSNIVDLTIYPFDVYEVLNRAGARLLPVTQIRMGMLDYVFDPNNCDDIIVGTQGNPAYRIADSNDILFDLTDWTAITRKFNDFRDFPPYRTGRLYLPFIGVMDFDLTNYYGKYMKIKYAVDISNGGCRAFVCIATSSSESDDGIIVASYDGQMGFHTPVTGADWSAYVNGIIQALGNTISNSVSAGSNLTMSGGRPSNPFKALKQSVATGGADAFSSALALNQADLNAPLMTRGSSSPCLNNYTDFGGHFIWNEMKTTESSNLLQLQGYPSDKSGALSSFSGFLSVSSCDLSCPKATEKERNMIMNALTSGIYI